MKGKGDLQIRIRDYAGLHKRHALNAIEIAWRPEASILGTDPDMPTRIWGDPQYFAKRTEETRNRIVNQAEFSSGIKVARLDAPAFASFRLPHRHPPIRRYSGKWCPRYG
jgi:hypothetical protein